MKLLFSIHQHLLIQFKGYCFWDLSRKSGSVQGEIKICMFFALISWGDLFYSWYLLGESDLREGRIFTKEVRFSQVLWIIVFPLS